MGGGLANQAFRLLVAVNHFVENGHIGGLDLVSEFREIPHQIGNAVFMAQGPGQCLGLLEIVC